MDKVNSLIAIRSASMGFFFGAILVWINKDPTTQGIIISIGAIATIIAIFSSAVIDKKY